MCGGVKYELMTDCVSVELISGGGALGLYSGMLGVSNVGDVENEGGDGSMYVNGVLSSMFCFSVWLI